MHKLSGLKLGIVVMGMLLLSITGGAALACTTFQLKQQNQVYFGRNYDWFFSDALVIINQKGVAKPGYVARGVTGKPASWTSKYASLTFNQYGREFPAGGMNSAGLVVESMSLEKTEIPPPDDRPYVAFGGVWRQYLLDNFATVSKALAGIKKIRFGKPPKVGVHLLISDAGGDCAIIEFLEGKLKVYRGNNLPVRVLANSTYQESLRHFQQNSSPLRDKWSSIKRFKTAAAMVQKYHAAKDPGPVAYAFKVLKAVANSSYTQWSIVYDQKRRVAHFHTKLNPKLRSIDLKKLDLACAPPAKAIDIDAPLEGDITAKLTGITPKDNRDLIGGSFKKTDFLKNLPQRVVDYVASYPDKCKCATP